MNVESAKELSMIELTHMIMTGKGKSIVLSDLVKEIQELLEISDDELAERLSQFYTDLNIDGRFIYLGEAGWGLRGWYPYEQIDEEVIMPIKPKKKKRSKKAVKDLEDFEEEDLLDEDEEFLEDEEDLLVDDEDLLDEDLLDEDDEDEDLLDEDDEDLLDEDEDLLDEDLVDGEERKEL